MANKLAARPTRDQPAFWLRWEGQFDNNSPSFDAILLSRLVYHHYSTDARKSIDFLTRWRKHSLSKAESHLVIRSEHESASVPRPCFSSESQLWMSLSTQLIGDYLCRNYTPFSSEFMIRHIRFITTTSQHISNEAIKHVQVEWIALLPLEYHHLYPVQELACGFRRSWEVLLVSFTCKTSSSCGFLSHLQLLFRSDGRDSYGLL